MTHLGTPTNLAIALPVKKPYLVTIFALFNLFYFFSYFSATVQPDGLSNFLHPEQSNVQAIINYQLSISQMAFKSLNQVLGFLANQPLGLRLAEYKRLLECWSMAVGLAVANQSRPLSIDDRRVLKVATSSAALAQDLMFKRRGILQKLNALLPTQLVDIRFSTAQWGESVANRVSQVAQEQEMWREHPSRILDHSSGLPVRGTPVGSDPQGALQNWAQRIQARSQSLPLCPACQCPTPPGELERWSVCALCATKQWSSQLGSPPF